MSYFDRTEIIVGCCILAAIICAVFWAVEIDRENKREHAAAMVECVQKTNDPAWCVEVLR